MKYLGIDFGTTFTKAAIFDSETEQIILVELNPDNTDFGFGKTKFAMPTVVLVGISPYNRTYEVGYKAQNMKRYPGVYVFENFKTLLDSEDEYANSNPDISLTELVQAVLTHVYNTAKLQTLSDFDKIVITVPASTVKNSPRWMRMLTAANNVFGDNIEIDIICEPEAAGFALLNESLKKDQSLNNQIFLVYDFGGGTFDASVFQVRDEQIFVIGESVGSDEQRKCGGIYIDDIIRKDYRKNGTIINTLIDEIDGKDLREQIRIEEMLRIEPIKAKIALSSQKSYSFTLMDYVLTSEQFDNIVRPMVEETIAYSKELIDSKEEEGSKISLKDIDKIFLVGGSSRIKIIGDSWSHIKSLSKGEYKFAIEYANIEVVAVGAAKYNYLRVSSERLIELGIIRLHNKDYNTAALYFRNANNAEGSYMLGLLYFNGLIGTKKNYAKAIYYFKMSNNEKANMMLAYCAFQGRHGLPRNHELAREYLRKGGEHKLTKDISAALLSPTQNVLESIYNFDSIQDVLDFYDVQTLLKRKNENLDSNDIVEEESVAPCDPDLDYQNLMNFYNKINL